MKKKTFLKLLKISFYFFILCVFSIILSNKLIQKNASEKTFSETKNIPKNKVGLILGTSKHLIDGRINLYYKYRLDAAVKLYKAGKVEYIVISGDNGSKNYDEPTDFKTDLIKLTTRYFIESRDLLFCNIFSPIPFTFSKSSS